MTRIISLSTGSISYGVIPKGASAKAYLSERNQRVGEAATKAEARRSKKEAQRDKKIEARSMNEFMSNMADYATEKASGAVKQAVTKCANCTKSCCNTVAKSAPSLWEMVKTVAVVTAVAVAAGVFAYNRVTQEGPQNQVAQYYNATNTYSANRCMPSIYGTETLQTEPQPYYPRPIGPENTVRAPAATLSTKASLGGGTASYPSMRANMPRSLNEARTRL